MPAVVTADIEQSTSMLSDELEQIIGIMKSELEKLKADETVSDYRFFRGDSVQIVIPSDEDAFSTAMLLKTAVNTAGTKESGRGDRILFDLAVSVGYGPIDGYTDLDLQNDKPFVLSGRGLENLKQQSLTAGVFTGDIETDLESDTLFFMFEWIMKQWSLSSAEIVFHKLKGLTEKEMASKLGISQSAVNQRSRAACWNGLDRLIKRCARISAKAYD